MSYAFETRETRQVTSPEALAALRECGLAYIKAVASEKLGFLYPEAPLLAPGASVFVLHAADGTPIVIAESYQAALEDAARRHLETVSLH